MAQENEGDRGAQDQLLRLEEAVAFNERTVEELNKQIVDLYQKMEQLSGRIVALESRIREMLEEPTGPGADDQPDSI